MTWNLPRLELPNIQGSMVSTFTYDEPEFCPSSACHCCCCCEVHDTLQYHTTALMPLHSLSVLCRTLCSMAWPSSIAEPSPKLAPQQQMKSSPSAGFPQTLCSQAVLSKEGCSRGPFTVEAVLIVTLSLALSLLLRCSALCVAGTQAAAARPGGCVSAL